MDLKQLGNVVAQDEEGAEIVIYQPDGEPYKAADGTDATMTVLGSESKRYRAMERRQQQRGLRRARSGSLNLTPEEMEADAVELAASAVIAWHGWESDGAELPCEPDNLKKVLKYKHIFEQVNRTIHSHAHFFVKSSTD